MTALDKKLSLLELCWKCQYLSPERVGDLIIGDFLNWKKSELEDQISFVEVLNEKGKRLVASLSNVKFGMEISHDVMKTCGSRLLKSIMSDDRFNYE